MGGGSDAIHHDDGMVTQISLSACLSGGRVRLKNIDNDHGKRDQVMSAGLLSGARPETEAGADVNVGTVISAFPRVQVPCLCLTACQDKTERLL